MPVIKPADVEPLVSSNYPAPHDHDLGRFEMRSLGDAGGLTQFGAHLETLYPDAYSSLRHWHENEDEFLFVLTGEVTLIDDTGDQIIRAGEAAAFKAGDANGHHLQNRTDAPATYLIVGTRTNEDRCHYSDVDMLLTKTKAGKTFTKRDGSPLQPDG